MSLDGTEERPHFDRAAFRVKRIYATLAADGLMANVKLLPDEQLLKCESGLRDLQSCAQCMGQTGLDARGLA